MRLRHLLSLALLLGAAPVFAQGTLVVTNTFDVGAGTLRAAVNAANATPGPQTIIFNIPTSDPNFTGTTFYITIEGNSLNLSTDEITVDGTTQTAFTGDTNPSGPEITIFGSPINPENRGFIVSGDHNVIRGLGGFNLFRYGIEITGDDNTVEGCFFVQSYSAALHVTGNNNTIGGTAPGTGNRLSSSGIGVWIRPVFGGPAPAGNVVLGNVITGNHSGGVKSEGGATATTVGGADPAARNYIYANGHVTGEFNPVGFHVELSGNDNVVRGNWVGLNEAGADASGAAADAVTVLGSNNTITGNVIGGMETFDSEARYALIVGGGTGNVVRGNLIGTDPTGTQPRPSTYGILASSGSTTIGGTSPGDGNTIAYNEQDGVLINGGPSVAAILGNAIFDNGALGIDLGNNGLTPNDVHDPDAGANRLQNHPAIASAMLSGSTLTVTYAVDTAPANATYPLRVEFFRADADGEEGQVFLGADTYTAADYNAGQPGSKSVTLDVSGSGLGVGDLLVATATDAATNTSEFGVPEAVVGGSAGITVAVEPVSPPVVIGPGGGSFQFTITLTNTTAQAQTFQAWTSVTGPISRNPVLGPQTVTLPAGGTVTRTLRQVVPGAAPAGTYTYTANVGTFPGVILSSDSFPVVKQAARAAASATAAAPAAGTAAWAVTGWDDAASASVTTALPGGFALGEVHPNPFRGRARLTLEVAEAQAVAVEAFDGLGRRVAVLHDGMMEAGQHALVLDGSSLPAGVYVVRVTGEAFSATRRATLTR